MSKTHEAPPDSWDMDSNDTNQSKGGDPSVTSINSGLSAVSLNVNAPAVVPNVNAPAFVPSMVTAPAHTAQMSTVPGGSSTPVNATSIQNGKNFPLLTLPYFGRNAPSLY